MARLMSKTFLRCKRIFGTNSITKLNSCNQVISIQAKNLRFLNMTTSSFFVHYNWCPNTTVRNVANNLPYNQMQCTLHTWEKIKAKEKKLKDAQSHLMEDFRETKAKVRHSMGEIIERENIWTIPNMLCASRIAASPVLGYLVVSEHYNWALWLLVYAGITDVLDGFIARRFPSQASRLGSFLDPLADKILVSILFLTLTYNGIIPLLLTVLIICRDVAIIAGASYIRYKSLPPPRTMSRYFDATHATAQLQPTLLSKINTGVQLGLVCCCVSAPVFSFIGYSLLNALCWLTAGTTVSSGLSYIFSNTTYKILKKKRKE